MNSIIKSQIKDLRKRFGDSIIAIYGVGSYFDKSLPKDWNKNDIDIIVVMQSLDSISNKKWTTVKFEKNSMQGIDIWIGYNSLQGLQDKVIFKKESFSNYEWSVLDLKYPSNSSLLYGQDIRNQLPSLSSISFDLDDLLRRSLYHLNKSYKKEFSEKNIEESKHVFTKAVFKFGFFLCVNFDEHSFRSTSIRSIVNQIKIHVTKGIIDEEMLVFLRNSIIYRRKNSFLKDFHKQRIKFTEYVFKQIMNGKLYRNMNYTELIKFMKNSFAGFKYLIKILNKAKEIYEFKN